MIEGPFFQRPVVYAFDPGGTTGVAVFMEGSLYLSYTLTREYRHTWLLAWQPRPYDTVVCEDYLGAGRLTTDGKDTLKLIGMIEFACLLHLHKPPVYQRSQARTPPFLARAKEALLALPRQQKWLSHHIDATAHGLIYLHRTAERNT